MEPCELELCLKVIFRLIFPAFKVEFVFQKGLRLGYLLEMTRFSFVLQFALIFRILPDSLSAFVASEHFLPRCPWRSWTRGRPLWSSGGVGWGKRCVQPTRSFFPKTYGVGWGCGAIRWPNWTMPTCRNSEIPGPEDKFPGTRWCFQPTQLAILVMLYMRGRVNLNILLTNMKTMKGVMTREPLAVTRTHLFRHSTSLSRITFVSDGLLSSVCSGSFSGRVIYEFDLHHINSNLEMSDNPNPSKSPQKTGSCSEYW